MRRRYVTKVANLTLALGQYPAEYFDQRLKEDMSIGEIYRELTMLAKQNEFEMCSRSAVEKQYYQARNRLNNVTDGTSPSTES